MLRSVAVFTAIFCLVSVPAFAVQPVNYATAKLGLYTPTKGDLKEIGSGFNGEVSYGHYFNPYIAGEIGVGYFSVDGDFSGTFIGVEVTEKDKLTVYPVTITGKGIIPFQKGELYGGVGLGVYFAKLESEIGNLGLGQESHSITDTAFGPHILFGGNYNLTPNIYIGGELKYILAKATFNTTFFGNSATANVSIDGFITTVNLGYRF
jgi:outer membrane protein W